MDVYKTEEEQGEALKKWLRDNGASLLTGLLLGLALLFGGKAWLQYGERKAEQASNLYTQLAMAVAANDEAAATSQYEMIIKDHGGSTYAVLAALQIARMHMSHDNGVAAEATLEWALENAKPAELREVTRERLVRAAIGNGNLDRAAALLAEQPDPAFAAIHAELRGDLALAQGDAAAAHAAYEEALAALPEQAQVRALLEAKRDDAVRVQGGAAS